MREVIGDRTSGRSSGRALIARMVVGWPLYPGNGGRVRWHRYHHDCFKGSRFIVRVAVTDNQRDAPETCWRSSTVAITVPSLLEEATVREAIIDQAGAKTVKCRPQDVTQHAYA
jgi:hypothetical protein